MTKSIISTIAFTVAFGSSVLLVGLIFGFPKFNVNPARFTPRNSYDSPCRGQKQAGIESLLRQDIVNGLERSYELRAFAGRGESYKPLIGDYSQYVSEYVEKSGKLDDSTVPADFRKAWREHMKAWRAYSVFLDESANATGNISDADFAAIENEHDAEITRTWNKVLDSAEGYYPGIRTRLNQ